MCLEVADFHGLLAEAMPLALAVLRGLQLEFEPQTQGMSSMATFDARLHMSAFEAMERGEKTVYTLLATPEFSVMCAGDRLEFGSFGSITIGTVRRYESLEALVEVEGWRALVPNASGPEHAMEMIRGIDEWDADREQKLGVVALRVREARRKT